MRDQAAALRGIPADPGPRFAPGPGREACVVASGKGGVGTSLLSALLAASLARGGRRTLLLDGEQNQGSLHVLLGVRPRSSLRALLAGEASPADLLVAVSERLTLLPGDSGAEALYGLSAVDRARLHHRLCGVYDQFDAVVVDGGSGLEGVVRVAGIRASRLAVVAMPEPAAVADAYALLKITHLQLPSLNLEVMVNRVAADEEGQVVFDRLALAVRRFLGRELRYLGGVGESEALRAAARRPGALLDVASEGIDAIARRLAEPAGAGRDDTRGMAP